MRRLLISLVVIGLVGVPAYADGPETGIVQGKVTDGQETGLPGVLLTLTGDRGSANNVSGADGSYRFALLVPGPYVLKAELEGFQGSESAVNVTAGGKHTVDVTMILGTAEEITVTSEAPMVDKFNVTAGTTIQAEIGTQTAGTTRSYYGLINALPGVTSDADNDAIQQTRPQVNGSHFADQAVFIDGVDTTFAKFGGGRVFLPTTSLTEISMETGGSSAEYGRAVGSWTNVIVKSGTNNLHGAALFQRQDVDWGADYKDQPALEQRQNSPFPKDYLKRNDFEKGITTDGWELSLGGPIKRNRAWFFVAASEFDDNLIERSLEVPDRNSPVVQDWLPNLGSYYDFNPGGDPIDTSFFMESRIFKFNFQPADSHTLTASFMDTPGKRTYVHPPMYDYWTQTPHVLTGELATLSYNWSISSNLFAELKLATQETKEDKTLACESTRRGDGGVGFPGTGPGEEDCLLAKQQDRGPGGGPLRFPANPGAGRHWPGNNYGVYLDNAFFGAWHNGWILSDGFGTNSFPRDQFNAGLTQFVGDSHELKYGLDLQETNWEGNNSRTSLYSGFNFDSFNEYGYEGAGTIGPNTCGVLRALGFVNIPGAPGQICLYRDYNPDFLVNDRGSGDSEVTDYALYVRDRFTLGDHLTFNVGVRAETQEGSNDIGRKVFDASYVSPRFAASYDFKGDGRRIASLNVGRYHAQLNQAWIAGGGTSAGSMHDMWNGFEGLSDFLFCDPIDAAFFAPCGGEVGYNFLLRNVGVGQMWDLHDAGIFTSNLDPYFKDEIVAGFEWQLTRNWALDTKLLWWTLNDMAFSNTQLGLGGEQFYLTANYKDLPEILGKIEAARQARGELCNGAPCVSQASLDNFYEGRKDYKAVQVQFNRRSAGNWAMYNNISWSETETTGSGAWWNNTNSNYGEDFQVVLTQPMIDSCDAQQVGRTSPVDCSASLTPFLGQPVSTINRLGKDINNDRPIIFNSFGFKTWKIGKQDFTLGGHLTFQSGLPFARFEVVPVPNLGGGVAANSNVEVRVDPAGAKGRRHGDEYTLNLSGAWGFPMGWKLRGEFRVEALNVTDQQRLRNVNFGRQSGLDGTSIAGVGEAYPARRVFQRPRQVRASFSLRF